MSSPTEWRNLTGLPLKFYGSGGSFTRLDPAGITPHVELDATERTVLDVHGQEVEAIDNYVGQAVGLPDSVDGVGLIVTPTVARAAPADRHDLWVPNELNPGDEEAAISCRGLVRRLATTSHA